MPVSPYVLLNHPSLLIFDPRDEIIKFPASLISGLTRSLYKHHHDSTDLLRQQEQTVRQAYRGFMKAITSVIQQEIHNLNSSSSHHIPGNQSTQVFWKAYLHYLYKTCVDKSANTIILNPESSSMKVVLVCLQAEVLGIPLIEMVWNEWNDQPQEDFFIAFMTVCICINHIEVVA